MSYMLLTFHTFFILFIKSCDKHLKKIETDGNILIEGATDIRLAQMF